MGVFATLCNTVLFFTIIAVNTGVPTKAGSVEDMYNASRDGDLAEVKRLAADSQCRNVNSRYGEDNRSPLHAAVEGNHTQVVEFLLNCRANVNVQDGCGVTPIMLAAENSTLAVVNSLLSSHPELDIKYTGDQDCEGIIGTTALMTSVLNTPEVVRALIEAGANVNIKAINGYTALMLASLDNRTETLDIVNILISANASLDTQTTGGPDYEGDIGITALMYASLASTPEVVRALVEAGANVNIRNSHGHTALMWATFSEGVHALVSGAKVNIKDIALNIKDIDGKTVLKWLTGTNRPETLDIVNILLSANADLDSQTTGGPDNEGVIGYTALMIASRLSTPEVVRALVSAGANVNIKQINGYTALMLASMDNRTETLDIVNALISANPDLDTQTTGGPGYKDVIGTTALMKASFASTPEVVRALVEAGANVNIKDINGYTALMLASVNNRTETLDIVNILLSANPDLDTQTTGGPMVGTTALMLASGFNTPEVVHALVKAGANRNLRDRNGYTARMWAAYNKKHKLEIQYILLSTPNAEGNGATSSQVITINSVMMAPVIILITRPISS